MDRKPVSNSQCKTTTKPKENNPNYNLTIKTNEENTHETRDRKQTN